MLAVILEFLLGEGWMGGEPCWEGSEVWEVLEKSLSDVSCDQCVPVLQSAEDDEEDEGVLRLGRLRLRRDDG